MRPFAIVAALVALLTLVHEASATKKDLYGLVGYWQGVCIKRSSSSDYSSSDHSSSSSSSSWHSSCIGDIIPWPYYVEFGWDSYQNKYYTRYRRDGVSVTTTSEDSSARYYNDDPYTEKGWCDASPAKCGKSCSSGWCSSSCPKGSEEYCINVYFDHDRKWTYRAKHQKLGDLDLLIIDGEWDAYEQYSGVYGKCLNKSWKGLFCTDYSYSYRCYLGRTFSVWKW